MRKIYILLISLASLLLANASIANPVDKALKKEESRRAMLTKLGGGDYVHAGDKESIDFLLSKLENIQHLKDGNTLDIGSGYGGTADYLIKKGFKNVWGIDKDANAVDYAKAKYPKVKFSHLDANDITKKFRKDFFSFIYIFNVFYAVEDKETLLKNLATISEEGAVLAVFESEKLKHKEYINSKNVKEKPPVFKDFDGIVMQPIEIDKFSKSLKKTGWEITESINITKEYIAWYESYVARMRTHRAEFLKSYPEKNIEEIENIFHKLQFNLKNENLGGRLIIARKIYGNRKG